MTDTFEHNHSKVGRNEVEPPSRPGSTDSHHVDLRYPEIPLHLSLDSLLAHSSSSSSSSSRPSSTPNTIMQPSDPDQGSLDDSWASLVDVESSNEDDLQSEHTDVGSLLDVHSSDDIQSVSDGVHIHDIASSDEEGLEDTLTEELDRQQNMDVPHERGFIYNHPPRPLVQATYSEKEDEEARQGPISTYTISRLLSEEETRKLPHRGQSEGEFSNYFSVIRMPILDSGLDLDVHNYFKVLLLGRHVEQFRPELQRKLGDVLVARPFPSHNVSQTSVSRYHLVPNTFGPGAEPDFADLVAIDKLIDFDCYDLVQSSSGHGQQEQLILRNSQTHSEIVSKWSGSRFVVGNPRWTLPDVAIICVHLDDEGSMNSDSRKMISFVERQGIPKILIRMDRGWDGDYQGSVNSDALHECVQTQPSRPQLMQHESSPKLPLNMAAFLNLDATVLNRHIAYAVLSAEQTQAQEVDGLDSLSKEPREKPSRTSRLLPAVNTPLMKNVFVVLYVVSMYIFVWLRIWPMFSDPTAFATPGDIIVKVTAHEQAPSTGIEVPMSTCTTSTHSDREESEIGRQLLDTASINVTPTLADDALHFQVGIAGEGQLLVRLPKVALSRKKRSPLSVELKRKNQTVPVSVQELFEGVFSVHLQPRDTHGDIEVNLTMRKPHLSETFTVSFQDRSTTEFSRLKKLLSLLIGHDHEKASSAWAVWKGVRERLIVDDEDEASSARQAREGRQRQNKHNAPRDFLGMSTLLELQSRLGKGTQFLQGEMARMTEGYAIPEIKLGDVLSDGLSNTRLRLLDTAEFVKMQFAMRFTKRAALEHLAAAQGRAKQIVAKAARKVRASKARV
ncbi:hypothetical protein AYL99_02329 [Fonsecaea erecta]|uniref:Uncharacterized protein n=1 Tax=Fonsecaea erecta TaxID=1367422 RepID=A0A178ZTM5_9EURO|nr:hypothetical protein AYL99_02329 [Fonsecaea erecta]OAP63102.1 hypothetical protein AYL99_02329 [Fonsecaea erecta]